MANIFNDIEPKLSSVKKFYFLEYFYILLKSVSIFTKEEDVFYYFISLKDKNQLGESKYKKLTINIDPQKLNRYRYTFNEVVEECTLYDFIARKKSAFSLTTKGWDLLTLYEKKGQEIFNEELFKQIEEKLNGFYYLVDFCYKANKKKDGLLIFPSYSPLKLGFLRSELTTTNDFVNYCEALTHKFNDDFKQFLERDIKFFEPNRLLLERLFKLELLSSDPNTLFDAQNYNLILKRIRDYWLNYFLKEIYHGAFSLSYFDIWSYRGRQLGIVNTTEFYPNFSGKIMYPISIIDKGTTLKDFKKLMKYPNKQNLFIHKPRWTNFQDDFVSSLYESYFDLKRSNRSYFINLADLRDIVCYKLKISVRTFVDFLNHVYSLNLQGKLRIKISLETDKSPKETRSMYLKRESILVDGRARNIIAIDLEKNK